jgi:hypothetical protein
MRSVSTAHTGPITVRREDQRLCCAIGFGAQNTTICMSASDRLGGAGLRHNGGTACGYQGFFASLAAQRAPVITRRAAADPVCLYIAVPGMNVRFCRRQRPL